MKRELKLCGAVFLVALVVRLVVLAMYLPDLRPDAGADYYRELGRNLAAGKGFVALNRDGVERPNVGRTPGYPLFLAGLMIVCGDRLAVFLAANCVLAALTCVLTAVLAARWLRWRAASLAALIAAVDVNSVIRCLDVKTEMLFTFLFVAGVCLLAWRREDGRAWLACGCLWALAALCRPVGLWLPVVALVAAMVWRVRVRLFALLLAGFVPLVSVWIARNAMLTGHWMFSVSGRYNLITAWTTGIEAKTTGEAPEVVQKRLGARVGDIESFNGREQFEQTLRNHHAVARQIMTSAPWLTVREGMLGIVKVLIGPGQHSLDYALREPKPAARWWPPLYSAALVCLVGMSMWGAIKLKREGIFLAALVAYFVVLSASPTTNSRFRYPIVPVLAVLAVAGWTERK